jgi:predicted Ser/Thr protein kinase/tetratricopeptide (TPR) repeat protein
MLGKYERLDVLGHGASGIVYLAKDTLLGRQVALKEVAAQGEDKERMLGEARVLDRLRHLNIVQVIGVDEIDGKVVIAMEYVRGPSLQDILRQTPQLPAAEAVGIAAQICDGLAFAHARRTVHRDVKPANILVDRDGVVKLVDFGLAEVLGTHSFAGGAGTFAYMAPEDFHEEEQSDRQSDIWAAGVILYEMLAGRRPFQVLKAKDPFAWKRAIEETAPSPISAVRPDIPPEIDSVLARALAKEKGDRYRDAEEMARDLRALGLAPQLSPPLPAAPLWAGEPNGAAASGLHFDAPTAASPFLNGPSPSALRAPAFDAPIPDFPPVSDIDGFLAAAPDHWPEAQAALAGGALERWLIGIGEAPLAEAAREIAVEPGRDDDERLRDFLYRAGLETSQEARRSFADGERRFKAGQLVESICPLRRAARLDPGQAHYHQRLAQALRAVGDSAGAAAALEQGLSYHPAQHALAQARRETAGAQVAVSTDRIDFGVLRQGQSRSARLTVRNGGSGVLEGRVASAPGWVHVEPAAFTTRQRQPLTLTAQTAGIRQAPAAFQEQVVLETSGGRQEIAVLASILPARRTLEQIWHWYLPLLFCCLLPALAGTAAPVLGSLAPGHGHHSEAALRDLWQPGLAASGLLCGSLFVIAFAADVVWALRLIPLALIGLFAGGFAGLVSSLGIPSEQMARAGAVQTCVPILVLLVLQAAAVAADPYGWGRWQLWRWIVVAVGLLVSYALLHLG